MHFSYNLSKFICSELVSNAVKFIIAKCTSPDYHIFISLQTILLIDYQFRETNRYYLLLVKFSFLIKENRFSMG